MPSVLTANHHSHGYRDKKQKTVLSVSLLAAYMPSVLTANHHSQGYRDKQKTNKKPSAECFPGRCLHAWCANCKQALTMLQLSTSLAAAHTTYVPTSIDIVPTSTHKATAGKPQC